MILELKDERNALERFMLHFSHLKKETRKLDDGRFMVKLHYDKEDRTEMLIRILSFGPVVKVKCRDSVRNFFDGIDTEDSGIIKSR